MDFLWQVETKKETLVTLALTDDENANLDVDGTTTTTESNDKTFVVPPTAHAHDSDATATSSPKGLKRDLTEDYSEESESDTNSVVAVNPEESSA